MINRNRDEYKWGNTQTMSKKMREQIKKTIGDYEYLLSDGPIEVGDWVISKHQIDEQIGNTNEYMNHVFNKPFEIGIGQCKLDDRFNPPMLFAPNIAMSGNALQEKTYKIIRTNNPDIPMSWDDLLEQEDYLFDIDSNEELEKKAVEFYEFWYDKYGTSEIDEIERRAVIHAFLGGCRYILENCN